MKIGIGLPNTIPSVTGQQLVEWARRADAAGFSSLGTIDRIVYPNYEPLVALAAAAAVTERIKLTPSILIVPYRVSAAVVAKQAGGVGPDVSNDPPPLVLGGQVGAQARETLGRYYAFLGDFAEMLIGWAAKGEEAVQERVEAFRQVGCDELIMIPCSADPGQVDKLAAAVL